MYIYRILKSSLVYISRLDRLDEFLEVILINCSSVGNVQGAIFVVIDMC